MEGTLVAFRLKRYDKNAASELVRRLYGQRTSSHGGKYAYWRRGLLDDIPYVRLIRGVIIVHTDDAKQVMDFLQDLHAEVHVRQVKLIPEDLGILAINKH